MGVSEKKKLARSTPIVYKLESYTKHMGYMANGSTVADRASAGVAGDVGACTYSGIKSKTFTFLTITLLGYLAYFFMHGIFKLSPNRFGALPKFVLESSIHQIDITITELVIFIVAAVITAIIPFIASFFRGAIPVAGTIYAVYQGYFIGFLTGLLKPQYRFIPILPFTKEMVHSYFSFLNSPAVSLVISLVFMAAAILFLLVDFDTVRTCVEKGVPQKYEWMAAWGLTYTVIYIYSRVFGYLMRIFSLLAKNQKQK